MRSVPTVVVSLAKRHTVLAVTAVVGVLPFAVALAVLQSPRWYPTLDIAQIELRVRDVGTRHRPQVGLPGRIDGLDRHGSHPGPLGFWALWPLYRLWGGSAWALHAATASLNVLAIGAALWLTNRRGGAWLVIGMGGTLVVLMRAYGFDLLTIPWNPYLPLLWWMVFLLAAWSLLCKDWVALPIAVVAGSMCAQTHVSYVGLVGAVGGVAFVAHLFDRWRQRGESKWRTIGAVAGALALLILLWMPPILEQHSGDPGNLAVIRDAFTHPTEPAIGLGSDSLGFWFRSLDIWGLLRPYSTSRELPTGSPVPGLLLLVAWAASGIAAWRVRHMPLLKLHLVLAVALLAGLVSISNILGRPWYWLTLWAWGTTALIVFAVLWTASVLWDRSRQLAPLLTSITAVTVALVTFSAAHAAPPPIDVRDSDILAHIAPQTIDALQTEQVPGAGPAGRFLVSFDEDPYDVGSTGQGLVLELERQGFDVGVPGPHGISMTSHRVREPAQATATLHQVVGDVAIARWRAEPSAHEIAFYEPRTEQQIARFMRAYAYVASELRKEGLDSLANGMRTSVVAIAVDPRVPQHIRGEFDDLLGMAHPTAVFLVLTEQP